MNCWICGDHADSREHRVKASDLRRFFGNITPSKPVFFHTESRTNLPIHSAKSDKLKTGKVICQRCNDTRTSKYDDAWEKLSQSIFDGWSNVKKTRRLLLHKAFPGQVGKRSVQFHLYFVKLFGCRIVDEKIPIEISEFSRCVVEGRPHSNVYLTFITRDIRSRAGLYVGPSEVYGEKRNGVFDTASWYYSLGELDVQVTWFKNCPVRNVPYAWHPEHGGKVLKFR